MTNANTLIIASLAALATATAAHHQTAKIETAFAPYESILRQHHHGIANAQKTIAVATYSISHPQIKTALANQHRKGLQVRILADQGQEALAYSAIHALRADGIPIRTDTRSALFHHKYLIIDDAITITGSANHTRSAYETNAENSIRIDDPETARKYLADFERNWISAKPYRDRRSNPDHKKPAAADSPPPETPPTTKDP
jgi:phosphatidylserine/phosphatidylglycerophosphate/cardiolipin synthase-like enzyme